MGKARRRRWSHFAVTALWCYGSAMRPPPHRVEEQIMPNVSAFNSKKESFHHDNSSCGLGTRIAPHNRLVGAAGKPLCKNCKKLNRDGK
jgi:hypothetical protein